MRRRMEGMRGMFLRGVLWRLLARLGLWRPGKIMYIGGSDVLPAPLTREEEQYYLDLAAKGDLDARNVLVERNLRLVAHIMNKG